jgi:hypothetical protein
MGEFVAFPALFQVVTSLTNNQYRNLYVDSDALCKPRSIATMETGVVT